MNLSTLALLTAIRQNDPARLRELIATGANSRVRSRADRTLLHIAAQEGSLEIAQILLDAGADIDARTEAGDTPLHFAASNGTAGESDSILCFHELREDGDPWYRDRNRPIHPGVAETFLEILRLKYPNIVAELEIQKLPADERRLGIFSLIVDITGKRHELREELNLAGLEVEALEPELADVLANYRRYVAMATFLIDHGANVNAFNKNGETPLHLAIGRSTVPMVELLLARGADPNIKFYAKRIHYRTPMEEALKRHRLDEVRALRAHGGELNFAGLSPLHDSAFDGKLDFVLWLLEQGGDIDQRDDNGCTPVMRAAQNGRANIVEALCEKNAELFFQNDRGQTVLHLAATSWGACVRPLLSKGLDLNTPDFEGDTPLHAAAVATEVEAIRLLAEAGANPNAQNKKGNSPLHAIFFSDEFRPDIEMPVFQALVSAGTDKGIRNHEGKTAFDLAVQFQYPKEYLDLLRLD